MKKNYIQPTIEALKMQSTELLAGSQFEVNSSESVDEALSRELGIENLNW